MTESLKPLLDRQAASVAFEPPDVDDIIRSGDRRIRRRRAGAVVAGVAAVAFVGGAVALVGERSGERDVVRGDEFTGSVSWAIGSTIHAGSDTVDVGHTVRAYVRTSVGFVVLDENDDVYSVTDEGVTRIGRMTSPSPDNHDQQLLAADSSGPLAGWVGEDDSGSLILETYDQASGESHSYPAPGSGPPDDALFFAIDDRTAYWRTTKGVFAVDVDTGSERRLPGTPAGDRLYDFEVYSVQNGVLAFSATADEQILVGPSIEEGRLLIDFNELEGSTDPIQLSPTGTWLSLGVAVIEAGASEEDFRIAELRPEVYDVSTGEHFTLDLDLPVAIPNVWLDEDTLQVLAGGFPPPAEQRLSLFTCTVPDGSCEPAVELAALIPDNPHVVLPDGRWYGPEPGDEE